MLTSEHEPDRRTAFIRSLRDLAAFLEAHPGVPAPRGVELNVFPRTRDDLQVIAKSAPAWDKGYLETWFMLIRQFGEDLQLHISVPRETVCRKVVIGTQEIPAQPATSREIVEWVCEDASLFASPSEAPLELEGRRI